MSRAAALDLGEPRPWRHGLSWLVFLAPFFYLTYGMANAVTARRHDVGAIVFAWEENIPFLAWTIIPYWSINLFYGASVLTCATRGELDAHVRRLLTAQVVAVTCFLAFPLRFTFPQPEAHGIPGFLFAALTSFDQPFNQAPSLHIALLVILWDLYSRHLPRVAQWPLHAWFALVGLSVLTTYQHHVIDIPTGALLGLICLFLWPWPGQSPLRTAARTGDRRRLMLAARYLAGAVAFAALAYLIGGAGLVLFWPAVSLALVASSYAALGPEGFQKGADGRMSVAARLLLTPYLAGAWINSRLWTRRAPKPVAVGDGVFLGRFPGRRDTAGFAAIVDLAAELPGGAVAHDAATHSAPLLPLPALCGERVGVRGSFHGHDAPEGPLTRPPSAVDLSPRAGRGGSPRRLLAIFDRPELPAGAGGGRTWIAVPMLDLVVPPPARLRSAAASIERARSAGPVLVCCAVGYSRSAAAVATWLVTSGRAGDADQAIGIVRRARPGIVIGAALREAIAAAAEQQR